MDGMLSQDEINALLNGMGSDEPDGGAATSTQEALLSSEEEDALGEVANISMGTAATTLSSLLNQKVNITTPQVSYLNWDDLSADYERPCVLMHISYREGIDGNNVLVLREDDVKIITDLMMGGSGEISPDPLSELHLSAIGEAMNQMMGSAATSMSTLLGRKIDITPPTADLVDLNSEGDYNKPEFLNHTFVKVAFKMQIGDLIDSELMQLYPVEFAQELHQMFMEYDSSASTSSAPQAAPAPAPAPQPAQPAPQPMPQAAPQPMPQAMPPMEGYPQPMMGGYPPQQPYPMPMMGYPMQPMNVQQASFQAFNPDLASITQKENIGLIMDVPLEVTVELGRTHKSIADILEFAPGTIVELNKIAGEPIDVLVNGKYVAKGEVVVIEESFGVRITEVVK
ncbi:MAG: flagellar motor switch phosphatase FliY [Alistipes sp.]|nr:flagellar motor switch phosphatase FliY [Alistipes sp.]